MALRELLDKNELQRLQDGFCKVSGLSAYCIDHDGAKITRISGDDRYLHCLQEKLALERVQGPGTIEDLAVEDIEGKKQVAALAISARGEKELYWILFRPEDMEEDTFYQGAELLRIASITLLQGKIQSYGAQANEIRNQADTRKMGRSLKMIQCMGRIVQLLDSENSIEAVMNEWLNAVSAFMELDTAQIFKLQEDEKFMDVICEWRNGDEASFFQRTSRVPAYAFLKKRKRLVINADSITDPEVREIFQLGVKSMMICPAGTKEGGIVVALNHRRTHVFDDVDESFASDAIKILDSILIRRVQKNSLTCAYASMEAVLDGLSTCVMVRDEARRKLVYVNQAFQTTFGAQLKDGKFAWICDAEAKTDKDGAKEKSEGEQGYRERREVHDETTGHRYDLTVTDVRWVDGNLFRMYSLYDVTGVPETEEAAEEEAEEEKAKEEEVEEEKVEEEKTKEEKTEVKKSTRFTEKAEKKAEKKEVKPEVKTVAKTTRKKTEASSKTEKIVSIKRKK